ncbi:MAG: fibronectin type III domain-containing protein, partial [bacterium]
MLKKIKGFVPLFTAVIFCLRPALLRADWNTSLVDSSGWKGKQTSIAIDYIGYIHLVCIDDNINELIYKKWNGTEWSGEAVTTNADYPSIAVDIDGDPHISYFDTSIHSLKYAKKSGIDPFGQTTVDSGGATGKGKYSSIAIDGMGYPHIAYFDEDAGKIKYAQWSGISWSTETITPAGTDGVTGHISLALDGEGNPHISFQRDAGEYQLYYVTKTPETGWSNGIIADAESFTGMYSSIGLDGAGNVHISHYLDGGTKELRYSSTTASAWSSKTVYSGIAGRTSIALDGAGIPHIIYYEPSTWFRLNYSSCPDWHSSIVDGDLNQSRDMGEYNSLALNSDGRVCISYSSYSAIGTDYDLRFATSSFTFAAPMGGNSRGKVQAPANFGGAVISPTQINWSWTNNSSNAIGYRVYCSSVGGNFYLAIDTAALTGNGQTGANHTGLCPNTSYQAYAAAVNAGGVVTSGPSDVKWTEANPPSGSYVVSRSSYSVKISWSNNFNPPYTKWSILRSADNFASTTTLKESIDNYTSTSFLDTSAELNPYTTYWYHICSYNADDSLASFDTTISTITLPGPPVAAGALSGTGVSTTSINWSWTDTNSGATAEDGYRVKRPSDNSILAELDPDTTYWPQTGLSVNISTSVYVEAYNESGTSTTTASSAYTLANPPTGSCIVSRSSYSVTISWSENSNPSYTRWEILRSPDNFANSTTTIKNYYENYTSTSYVSADLLNNLTYWYKIHAYNNMGFTTVGFPTSYDTTISTITLPGPPVAAGSLSGTGISTTSINWSWTDTNSGATAEDGYRVRRQSDNSILADLDPNTTFWPQTGLSVNISTSVYVEAYNESGTSITAAATSYALANPPTGNCVVSRSSFTVTINWSANGNPSYTRWGILRSMDNFMGSTTTVKVFLDTYTVTSCTDTALSPNTTYWYKIRAFNGDGIGTSFSNTASTITLDGIGPSAITDLAGTAGTNEGELTLTWTAPGDDGGAGIITGGQFAIQFGTYNECSWGYGQAQIIISTTVVPSTQCFYTLTGLSGRYDTYVKIWTADEFPNWSPALESSQALARGFNPASIDTLSAITGASIGEIDLTWTAPGDDGTSRYVNNGKWRIAYTYSYPYTFSSPEQSDENLSHYYIVISTSFTPGSVHNYTITGLVTNTDYYFRMWAADENPLWSGISNEASAWTLADDTTNPGNIIDLAVSPGDNLGEIKLTWIASGDDGYSGTADYYDIRYLTANSYINEETWDDAEVNAVEDFGAVIPDPLPAGTTQSLVITGLTVETKYYFAIKVYDEADNESNVNANYNVSWTYPKSSEDPPSPPPSLTGEADSISQINWSWYDTADELGYKLYNAQNNLVTQINFDAVSYCYNETGLQPNTSYYRYVVAWNA